MSRSDLPAELTGVLGPEAARDVARLCRRALGANAPVAADVTASLFGEHPVTVRGIPDVGVVASAVRQGQGHIRLLAVDPAHRRRGVGRALLKAAEADLAGCPSITVGADPPDHLFPGVDSRLTAMQCLLEERGYALTGVHLNLDVDLRSLPPDPGTAVPARAAEADEIRRWTDTHWANWTDEVMTALAKDRLLLARDETGITGFCAWDVTRRGWLGPIAVRPDIIGGRIGVPLLIGALSRMRDAGRVRAEIGWIGPLRFYARTVGAVVGTAYLVYRKNRPAGGAG